jgi:putative addiction module component (TIGR02574 family)
MSNDARQVLENALQLDVNDRAKIAAELLASLEEREEGVAEAWAAEIQRRAADAVADPDDEDDWRAAFDEVRKNVLSR